MIHLVKKMMLFFQFPVRTLLQYLKGYSYYSSGRKQTSNASCFIVASRPGSVHMLREPPNDGNILWWKLFTVHTCKTWWNHMLCTSYHNISQSLVGGWPIPLWNIWVRQLGLLNSQLNGKTKFNFQTTNQYLTITIVHQFLHSSIPSLISSACSSTSKTITGPVTGTEPGRV